MSDGNVGEMKSAERQERPVGPLSFEQVMTRRRRKPTVYRAALGVLHTSLVLLTVMTVLWVPVSRTVGARREHAASDASSHETAQWPQDRIRAQYRDAVDYNHGIVASGQRSLGEALDPFVDGAGDDSLSAKDTEYQSMMQSDNGVMGTIRIPKISARLPIYHGTSKDTLQMGVGHLYGTSLPVGGQSTNSVLTGHRGLVDAELFTRLDELTKDDVIYIKALNRTLGYRVTGINVVEPNDVHLYKVVPGKDLITLMTCTPYGVNTQRLVITAQRGRIPEEVPPYGGDQDAVFAASAVGGVVLLAGLAWAICRDRRLSVGRGRHVAAAENAAPGAGPPFGPSGGSTEPDGAMRNDGNVRKIDGRRWLC
ncbi:class C sortase [Bifidobacterium sp. ESL0763]|uniref:class C sortase n=1 Tax=Bifidobacterium sp. ESL0763 TaxID=2983227 RepID=UPI0023F6F104|nr:class C sortase [Bifidobacterium sp. ESL0763]MDF7663944.1 class C sortase [Bifidobacterium sp. ESL0763]